MDSCAWCLNDLMSAHTQCPVSLQSSGDGCLLPQRPGTFLQLGTVLVLMSQSDYWGWQDPRRWLTTCCLITWAPSWLLLHSASYSAKNNSSCSEWELQLIQVLWCSVNFRFEENHVWFSLSLWWKVNIKERHSDHLLSPMTRTFHQYKIENLIPSFKSYLGNSWFYYNC